MQKAFRSPKVQVNLPVFMAPMVGLSHVAFRKLVRSYLPEKVNTLWPTEMLNSRRLPQEKLGQTLQTIRSEEEIDLIPQILGNEKENIFKSIKMLEDWGVSGVDINMGCPVKKALKHNYGVALMGDLEYAKQVTSYAVESANVPVSVKIRAGLQNDNKFLTQFVLNLQEVGASWICLHPRLASQKRRGQADWNQISLVKKILDIPVIGNGDIQTLSDVFHMFDQTQCDGVMIGRALTARPWLLGLIAKKLSIGESLPSEFNFPSHCDEEAYAYGRSLLKFINNCIEYFPEDFGVKRIRFFIKVGHPWLNFGHELYAKINSANTYEQAVEVVDNFFKAPGLRMSAYTDLKY
ncbi:MAG: tRNA-dihydrouridine synthase family protein [Bdellovibrionaceae bacterium]|nr:tRNA-dihydrouridine synthase family protein [Pseudobdellovibrionaceae bacterium]